jgi:hypothetical protein
MSFGMFCAQGRDPPFVLPPLLVVRRDERCAAVIEITEDDDGSLLDAEAVRGRAQRRNPYRSAVERFLVVLGQHRLLLLGREALRQRRLTTPAVPGQDVGCRYL